MFVDEARIMVAAGRGGDGSVSFHREKYKPRGGPDGGNGGQGGSVVLTADGGVGSLQWLRDHPHQRAQDGRPGARNNRTGADGGDLQLVVPPGTIVRDDEGHLLADLANAGDRFVVAAGGRGGRGNAAFLSDTRRAPGFGELGEPGQECRVALELRLIAEVTVIGLPNAGKSTLVSALSAATPKIAAYPFTTLEPTLGRVEPEGDTALAFTICDIPGLIEGAHEGKGLGLAFLRHAERSLAFVHLVDVGADVLTGDRDPFGDYHLVRNEILAYRPEMIRRPEVVVLNKIDSIDDAALADVMERFRQGGLDPRAISAAEGAGLEGLVAKLLEIIEVERANAAGRGGFELFRTEPRALSVERDEDGAWRLRGVAVERWVAMTDLSNPQAVAYLQERMERAGVEAVLEEAGARPGEEVRIGPSTFEWYPTGHPLGQARG